jgi:2-polyprenyl-3-methyl-5-hydroxy-6-metoxy-1,4-benzoquinol methylase
MPRLPATTQLEAFPQLFGWNDMLQTLKLKVSQASRAKKLDHFYSRCDGGKILDAGVSGSGHRRLPGENIFLTTFRFSGDAYVGLGVDDLTELAAKHPDKRFVTYDGTVFPFCDDEFDWVFSNAVIEHVGGFSEQVRFLNEMLRVGRRVFFTTPNRYFPVESHTNVWFLHWFAGDVFYNWCARHGRCWTRANLQLLSHANLLKVLKASNAASYEVFENRLLGWSMTFSVVCQK